MIDVASAIELIDSHFIKLDKEEASLKKLQGRVLRQPLNAKRDQPPFDRVAMDGIAIFANETNRENFIINGIQKAGHPPLKLENPDKALEVMTGAMLPVGTNTVIPYENISIKDEVAFLNDPLKIKKGQNIHFKGSDYTKGETLLTIGEKLSSAAVSLVAGLGSNSAIVSKPPQIAIISTGDELISPGKKCKDWQIWRSNPYGIQAELNGIGINENDIDLYHIGDNQKDMLGLFSEILNKYPILIISGGVSMGKFDFVHSLLPDLGVKKIFHKIKQRPGKPMYFGVGPNQQNVFGLPGNPVSALVCLRRYVIPALQKALGQEHKKYYAVLEKEITFKKSFSLFKAVKVQFNKKGQLLATPILSNGSGDFAGLANSDGFIQLPEEGSIYQAGKVFPFFSWQTGRA